MKGHGIQSPSHAIGVPLPTTGDNQPVFLRTSSNPKRRARGLRWYTFASAPMALSARVQQILQELTAAERAELLNELALDRELTAGQRFLDEALAEVGPIPEDEIARIRREWPRD
jgi:hypothetical protein